MTPYTIGPVENVHDYLNATNALRTEYAARRLYRGQTDDWRLSPKLFRAPLIPAQLLEIETVTAGKV
jgi:hypothetical protein